MKRTKGATLADIMMNFRRSLNPIEVGVMIDIANNRGMLAVLAKKRMPLATLSANAAVVRCSDSLS